ncbi:MAG: SUMF1/EgtB/PvdO family nonheme iron enzyme, partial [Verrucomicrobiales bacterium]|nr:SUMF1/EgtB/PvdO family nonheme iron enzyme [Verrucomicrobiales bacterium]
IDRSQLCYLQNRNPDGSKHLTPAPDILKRIGFRIPTIEEWIYAGRGNTSTQRYSGTDLSFFSNYAWNLHNSTNLKLQPAAQLKPNDFGLFDVLGNAMEWCSTDDYPIVSGRSIGASVTQMIISDRRRVNSSQRVSNISFRIAHSVVVVEK